ncbi:MAG: fumarylacetoacetate hydrolase family protein [Chloroflexota bacterium]|nr:fumarylacetoacetate hydrolase family protein [Chloroflexota bacterium]
MPLGVYLTDGRAEPRLGLIQGDSVIDLTASGSVASLSEALSLSLSALRQRLSGVPSDGSTSIALADVELQAPIDQQEVWAAGVTYRRSRDARMEESTQRDVYDRVYDAERPEIFFKATPNRVVGPEGVIAIRGDSSRDVPEPELTLVLNTAGETVGYTVGNDVSSRSIEGENPLYLPQAKMYRDCAALGPVIALAWEIENPLDLTIELTIRRGGSVNFQESTSTDQIHRALTQLVEHVRRHNDFPHGAFLMTGTGIIPPAEFTLEDGDEVEIAITGIGTLRNQVRRLTA